MAAINKPVEHIVLLRFHEQVDAATAERVLVHFRALAAALPELVLSITAGVNFTSRGKGYTHGAIVRLPSRAALEAYATHPVHVAFVTEHIKPHVADTLAFDYEVA